MLTYHFRLVKSDCVIQRVVIIVSQGPTQQALGGEGSRTDTDCSSKKVESFVIKSWMKNHRDQLLVVSKSAAEYWSFDHLFI